MGSVPQAIDGELLQQISELGAAPSLERGLKAVGAGAGALCAENARAVEATGLEIEKGAVAGHGVEYL